MNMKYLLVIALLLMTLPLHAATLYDGSLNSGTDTPDDQGWMYVADPIFGGMASHSASGGTTTLNTSATNNIHAGYFSRNPFSLTGYVHPIMDGVIMDRSSGYTLSFGLQILSESHASTDRAGFSVIILGNDLFGIELGFWGDEIWAQSGLPQEQSLFTHAEGTTNFNSTSALIDYNLTITGSEYSLYADAQLILSGALRNYSSFSDPILGSHPYDIPNFIFFGDDTSSASATSKLSYIEFNQTSPAVPEPSVFILFAFGMRFLYKKVRK